ncbi:MAG: ATP-binding protein [Ruminococcus sp.]|nr:ATP-binding protein [Ruminococcus sp.]
MQKRLFKSMTLLVSIALIIFSVIAVGISWSVCRNYAFSELKTAAVIAKQSGLDASEIGESLKENLDYTVRVTYIESDGTVSYDSEEDPADMENHLEREEVKQAFESGSGQAQRLSQTLEKTYCYYAVRYGDGVLRLARTRNSMISIIASVAAALVVAMGILIIVTTAISMKMSKSMMKPIHELVRRFDLSGEDSDDDDNDEIEWDDEGIDEVYEELEPVIETADKLLDDSHRIVRRLKKEKEKFSLITENMTEGMILLDGDKTVLSVNRTALQLFNPDYNPSSKLKLYDFTTDEQLWRLIDELDGISSARGLIHVGEQCWRTFVNQTEYAGKYGIVIILVDVTESLKSEEIRRDFSANVSHELKTPLTTIKGFGEMMEKGIISDGDDVKRYGGTIYREAARLLSLINDIIRLSEIEDGESKPIMEQVDLLEAARDCGEILQVKADAHDVGIEICGSDISVKGNKSYIVEMILNLMDNSIKYNRAGGSVTTSIEPAPNGANIIVEDTGIGISEADQERVFERFYRVDKSRSKATGGTGLGLSIVKHMVAVHGGKLSVKSKLGVGTRITIFLPFEQEDDEK